MFHPDWRRIAALAFCAAAWGAASVAAARVVAPGHPSLRRIAVAEAARLLHRAEGLG